MAQPLLSICIPTYDRNDILAATLTTLLPELTQDIGVLILDNASPTSVEETVRSRFAPTQLAGIRFHRHQANIGGNANITRCVELADSEWLWILGDDDPVLPGALQVILNSIKSVGPEVALICFASDKGGPRQFGKIASLAQLTQCITYDDFLFISTKIMRLSAHRPHLAYAYYMCYAHCPHVAMYLVSQSTAGSHIVMHEATIVTQVIPPHEDRWSYVLFMLTASSISLLPKRMEDKRLVGRWVATSQFFTPIKVLAFIAMFAPSLSERRLYFKVIKAVAFFHNFRRRWLFRLAAPLFIYLPLLANPLVRKALKSKGKTLPVEAKRGL